MGVGADKILFGSRAIDCLWLQAEGAGDTHSVLGINHQFWCLHEDMAFRTSGPEVDVDNPWDRKTRALTDNIAFFVAAQGIYAFEPEIVAMRDKVLWQGEDELIYWLPEEMAGRWKSALQGTDYRNHLLREEIALERFGHPAVLLASEAEHENSLLAWALLPRQPEQ